MKKILIPVGVVLIVAAGIWKFALSDQLTQRFRDGWEWDVSTLGTTAAADEASGNFPEGTTPADDPINITTRTISATTEDTSEGAIKLSDYFVTTDPATNAITWEYTFEAVVDAKTGKYIAQEYADDYFLFPRNVEQKTYHIRNTSYQGIPMDFKGEEEVSGINTYVFAYQDDLPNAAAYVGFVELEDGQTIVCYDFELRYWVEPKTGEVIKYKEWCPGDYVVDEASGEKLYALQRWTGETTGDDLIQRVDKVKSEVVRYNLYTLYLPVGLLLVGIVMGGAGVATNFTDKKEWT